MPNVYNSSGRDIDALHRGRPYNPAFLHPDDLAALGLAEGDAVRIASDRASIFGVATSDATLRRGVLSMSHCFGDAPERDPAHREIGSPTNRLVDNARDYDPITGIPRMSAIPVSIARAEGM
jgi:anaerobic selenocysteine-containing dehydrogenase